MKLPNMILLVIDIYRLIALFATVNVAIALLNMTASLIRGELFVATQQIFMRLH
jgi:hypothetical protein